MFASYLSKQLAPPVLAAQTALAVIDFPAEGSILPPEITRGCGADPRVGLLLTESASFPIRAPNPGHAQSPQHLPYYVENKRRPSDRPFSRSGQLAAIRPLAVAQAIGGA
jgi:hypothetical protein